MTRLTIPILALLLTGCAGVDRQQALDTAVTCAPSLALSRAMTAACILGEAAEHQLREE